MNAYNTTKMMYMRSLVLGIFIAFPLLLASSVFAVTNVDDYLFGEEEDDYVYTGDENEAPTDRPIKDLMTNPNALEHRAEDAGRTVDNSGVPLRQGTDASPVLTVDRRESIIDNEVIITEITSDQYGNKYVQKRFFRTEEKNNWMDVYHYDLVGDPQELKLHDVLSVGGKFLIVRTPQEGPKKHTNFDAVTDEHIVYDMSGKRRFITLVDEAFTIMDGDDAITTTYPVIVDDATGEISIRRDTKEYALHVLPSDARGQFVQAKPESQIADISFMLVDDGHVYAIDSYKDEKLLGLISVRIEQRYFMDAESGIIVGATFPFSTWIKDFLSF